MEEDFSIFELENGIQVVHKTVPSSRVGHLGIFIKAGSRNEPDNKSGLAHYVEHCLFKGTKKRKSRDILNRLDAVGGELDAFTSKEDTCVYATFLSKHTSRAVDLLHDITFQSVFPATEIKKEKAVIIDEIYSYQDSPFDQIFEDFEQIVFNKHPLGGGILGTVDSVNGLSKQDLIDFTKRYYFSKERIVISSVSNFPMKKIKALLEKSFANLKVYNGVNEKPIRFSYKPNVRVVERNTFQSHVLMGKDAYDHHHPQKTALVLLNNILGGPAMNSKLNLNVREKYGFTYNIESNYSPFSDSGLFSIYLGTDAKHVNKSKEIIYRELNKLKSKPLSSIQLSRYKDQLKAQIAIYKENNGQSMLSFGKSLLLHNKIDSFEQILNKIDNITSTQLVDVANEIFDTDKFSELTYKSNQENGIPT